MSVLFLNRLRKVIEKTQLSQAAFARSISMSPGFVSDVLKERCQMSEKTAHLISVVHNIDLNWLLNGEGEMQTAQLIAEDQAGYGQRYVAEREALLDAWEKADEPARRYAMLILTESANKRRG